MTWSVDSAVQVQNLITQIATRLTASGWTLTDQTADQVWHATNNQGVTQYIQITNCQNSGAAGSGAAWQYLQFQAWKSWDTGTHAGSNGSGTTGLRLYYAAANVAAATPVDLYMSVTGNRFIMFIQGYGNFRNWAYFGGLDAQAGTNDPNCALLTTSSVLGNYGANASVVLAPFSGGPTNWTGAALYVLAQANYSSFDSSPDIANAFSHQPAATGAANFLLFPFPVGDNAGTASYRGNLDGLCYCPLGLGSLAHLDTITVSGTTYLVICPGGQITGFYHPITGNYNTSYGLAIAEV